METLQKLGERCRERLEAEETENSRHRNSAMDLSRLRSGLVKDLLSQEALNLTAEKMHGVYHFRTEGDAYQVLLLKIDSDNGFPGSNVSGILQEKATEVLSNALNEICLDYVLYFQGYACYGILNFNSEKRPAVRKSLRDCLNQLDGKKDLFGNVEFSMALGRAVGFPDELPSSLKDAGAAVLERIMEGTGRLLEKIPQDSGLEKQNILDNYVKSIEHAIEVLSEEEAGAAGSRLETELKEINGVCGREILELVISAGRLFIARCAPGNVEGLCRDFDERCSQSSSVRKVFGHLQTVQKSLMAELMEVRRSESARPIRIAKQYVMKHYQEPITLETVCEAAGFSVSYFSTLFKKETGEGFAKYLTRIRMEKAKALLRETNLPVAEIFERVGYSDRKHFTATFHKTAGLNPAEYRKLYG